MKTKRIRGHGSRLECGLLILLLLATSTASALAEIIPADRRIQWDPGVRGGIPNRTAVFANVKNAPYKAVGNGVVDDTSAIQNAINACPLDQVVYIPSGTYKITAPLRVKSGITMRGDGMIKTVIKGAAGYGYNWLLGFEDENLIGISPSIDSKKPVRRLHERFYSASPLL